MQILKKFSFWFVLISIAVSFLNLMGQDDKNLLFFFFGLEPILYKMVYMEAFRDLIFDEANGKILWFGYLLRIIIGLFYGLVLDLIIYLVKIAKKDRGK